MPALLCSSKVAGAVRRPAAVPLKTQLSPLRVRSLHGAMIVKPCGRLSPVRVATPDAPEEAFEAVAVSEQDGDMSVADIKAALLDSLYGTERGSNARSEIRAEINELISQLEAKNPTPNPTEALDKLSGNWKLAYTSSSELIGVLALSRLPFVEVGEVTQKVDANSYTVENNIHLTVPFSRTTFTTTASFEVRSPKRLQLRLTKGGIQTPELMTDVELPSNISIMGQDLDLTQLKSALSPVNDGVKGFLGQMNNLLAQAPDLSVNVGNDRMQTWQLNTYVDEDTRVCRGDGGAVFIYVRDVSITTSMPSSPSPQSIVIN